MTAIEQQARRDFQEYNGPIFSKKMQKLYDQWQATGGKTMNQAEPTICYVCLKEFAEGENKTRVPIQDDQGVLNAIICDQCLASRDTATDRAHEALGYDDYDKEEWTCAYCGASYGGGYCWRSPDGQHAYDD